MATRPDQALVRLPKYNSDFYDASTNPFGLADGGQIQNFPLALGDLVLVANYSGELATEIEAYAVAAAASAARLQGTSTTARTPALGSLSFTTQANKIFDVGSWLMVQSRGTADRWAYGKVSAYTASTGALTIAVDAIGPNATAGADWNIIVSGARGAPGELQDISGKMDKAGGAFTGHVDFIAGTTAAAPISLPPGSAPTSPANGDTWTTTAGVFHRRGGVSRMFLDNTPSSLTNTLLASMAADTIKGQLGSAGGPSDLTLSQLTTALGFSATLQGNGILRLPLGFVLQWGVSANTAGEYGHAFPVAFPVECLCVVGSVSRGDGYPTNLSYTVSVDTFGRTAVSFRKRRSTNGGLVEATSDAFEIRWIAIGR